MFTSSRKRELINEAVSRRSRTTTAKKCTKKRFAFKPVVFFAVLVAVAGVVA